MFLQWQDILNLHAGCLRYFSECSVNEYVCDVRKIPKSFYAFVWGRTDSLVSLFTGQL